MQTERCCITHYFSLTLLAYFVLLRVVVIVFYFINSLFKMKSVSKLMQMSIKVFQISYFSLSLKLNEVSLKSMVWRGVVTRILFCWRGVLSSLGGLEIFQNMGNLTGKGGRKNNEGGVATLKEAMPVLLLNSFLFFGQQLINWRRGCNGCRGDNYFKIENK